LNEIKELSTAIIEAIPKILNDIANELKKMEKKAV